MLLERTRVRTHDVRVSASGGGLRSDEPCPTSEELVNYVLGILEVEPATEVEAHLLRCPDCRIEVEALRGALESLLVPAP